MQTHGVGVMRVQRQQSELLAADCEVYHFKNSTVGTTLARKRMGFRAVDFFARNELAVAQRHAAMTAKPAPNGIAVLLVGR
jgi:hypothetical protein